MAQSNNPFWGGDAPLDSIAEQIAQAHGPSGSNHEYLFKLAASIRTITSIDDEHLFTLDQLVKYLNHDSLLAVSSAILTITSVAFCMASTATNS